MGKCNISNAGLAINYTPSGNYTVDVVLNVCEVEINESQFDRSRDAFLQSQMDEYKLNILDTTANEFEDVWKLLVNTTCVFTPDIDAPTVFFDVIVLFAKPYYYKNNALKDAVYVELLQHRYRAGGLS